MITLETLNNVLSFKISGINAGRKLGVDPLLKAKDIADPNVEHLGVMAYAASFQWIRPRVKPSAVITASCDSHLSRIYQPVRFDGVKNNLYRPIILSSFSNLVGLK